ncbi:MAG TPA: hypothetical protein VMG12_01300 [Polyangiaceae bacterium]|nr:hypothetical protein [Polyangiaceae bacterium]
MHDVVVAMPAGVPSNASFDAAVTELMNITREQFARSARQPNWVARCLPH